MGVDQFAEIFRGMEREIAYISMQYLIALDAGENRECDETSYS